MGFNSGFKGLKWYQAVRTVEVVQTLWSIFTSTTLTLILLTWRIRWAPNNASKWEMRFNSALVERIVVFYGDAFNIYIVDRDK